MINFCCGCHGQSNKKHKISDTVDSLYTEFTFSDIETSQKERIEYLLLQDSLFKSGQDGLYKGNRVYVFSTDTAFIENGSKKDLLEKMKKLTLLYTNSAFVVRCYAIQKESKLINHGYSLWVFDHRKVAKK